MSTAEDHDWYGDVTPWTEDQLADYLRRRGFEPEIIPAQKSPEDRS